MAVWENVIKTEKGLALDQKMITGDYTLKLTKAESGKGRVDSDQLAKQTAVTDFGQTLTLGKAYIPSKDTSYALPVSLSNDGVEVAYTLYQVGVYAKDPDEGEILYFIAQSPKEEGEKVPGRAESPGFFIDWNFTLNFSNATTVEVTVDEAGRLSIEEAKATYTPITDFRSHVNDKSNPHEVKASQVKVDNIADSGLATEADIQAALVKLFGAFTTLLSDDVIAAAKTAGILQDGDGGYST